MKLVPPGIAAPPSTETPTPQTQPHGFVGFFKVFSAEKSRNFPPKNAVSARRKQPSEEPKKSQQ